MKLKIVNHSEVAVAILGAGLTMGLALKLLELLRPLAAILVQ